jgi:SAM-dependent methyltransferase
MYISNENFWLELFVAFVTILFGVWVYRYFYKDDNKEGFQQSQPYVFKHKDCDQIYDPFYIEQYDILYKTDKYSDDDYMAVIQHTSPSSSAGHSFLDIGCGTGTLLRKLETDGYPVFGIDKSRAMVEEAQSRLIYGEVICDDVLRDPMLYENDSFSHILCTHFTLYEIQDKLKLFRQCYNWIRSGGFFLVHVVEPEHFNMVVPLSDIYKHVKKHDSQQNRVTNTEMERPTYTYTNHYMFDDPNKEITQIEKFETKQNVRQNEKTMYMISKRELYTMAAQCGFQVYAENNYKYIDDIYQTLVIFIKPMGGSI